MGGGLALCNKLGEASGVVTVIIGHGVLPYFSKVRSKAEQGAKKNPPEAGQSCLSCGVFVFTGAV